MCTVKLLFSSTVHCTVASTSLQLFGSCLDEESEILEQHEIFHQSKRDLIELDSTIESGLELPLAQYDYKAKLAQDGARAPHRDLPPDVLDCHSPKLEHHRVDSCCPRQIRPTIT